MSFYSKYFNKPVQTYVPKFSLGQLPEKGTVEFNALIFATKAKQEWDSGNYEVAVSYISESIKLWPDNINYFMTRGEYNHHIDNFQGCVEDLTKYFESGGDESPILFDKLGVCLINLKRYNESKCAYLAAIDILVNRKEEVQLYYNFNYTEVLARCYNNLATSKLGIGQNEGLISAIENSNSALELKPNYPFAFLNLGLIHLKLFENSRDEEYLGDALLNFREAAELGNQTAARYYNAIIQKYGSA